MTDQQLCANPNCREPLTGYNNLKDLHQACYQYLRRKGTHRPVPVSQHAPDMPEHLRTYCACGKAKPASQRYCPPCTIRRVQENRRALNAYIARRRARSNQHQRGTNTWKPL